MSDDLVVLVDILNRKIQSLSRSLEISEEAYEASRTDLYETEERVSALVRDNQELTRSYESMAESYESRIRVLSTEVTELRALSFRVGKPYAFEVMKGVAGSMALAGNKIGAIKEIRNELHWGLKESKDFVEEWLKLGRENSVPIQETPKPTLGDLVREAIPAGSQLDGHNA